jgi:hypothetical protein
MNVIIQKWPVVPHRRVVSDWNSVPGDSELRVGGCVRPANLPWRQDLRTRLILVAAPHGSALPRTSDVQTLINTLSQLQDSCIAANCDPGMRALIRATLLCEGP